MLTATKEEIHSTSADPRVFFLAAREGVGENSRLGFRRKNVALHWGSALANSRTALRDGRSLAANTRRMSLLPQTKANNKPSFWSCTFSAGTGAALGTTALDAIGIIPGGGNVLHGVQLATGVGALALSIRRASFNEVAAGGASTGLAFADAAGETANIAIHGVEIVPVLGNIVSAGATVNDIFGKEGVISSYKACLSGGG
jgi:hypothetical protein